MNTKRPATETSASLILVNEISHRVVNEYAQVLAMIRMAAARTADPEALKAFASTSRRIRAFAEAHRALRAPSLDGEADLGNYLTQLCQALSRASLEHNGVRLVLKQGRIELDVERCWRAGLIISELITNAARHGLQGGTGLIEVDLRLSGTQVCCDVSDDGGVASPPRPGRGTQIVAGLGAELGGGVAWCFRANGTTASLSFPVRAGEEATLEFDLCTGGPMIEHAAYEASDISNDAR